MPTSIPAFTFTTIDDSADTTFNQLLGINDSGQIAGYFGSGIPVATHPNDGYVLFQPYASTSYSTAKLSTASPQIQAIAINNKDSVVGFEVSSTGAIEGFVGSVSGPGGAFTIGNAVTVAATAPGSDNFQLVGINDGREAVGFTTDKHGKSMAYTVASGATTATTLSALSGTATGLPAADTITSSQATGIDNAGDIVGNVSIKSASSTVAEGFILLANSATPLYLGGANSTVAAFSGDLGVTVSGINNNGQIAGEYEDSNKALHGFVLNYLPLLTGGSSTLTTIDDAAGVAGTTVVNGINDQGQVVGYYLDTLGATHGMLATPDAAQNISNPIAGQAYFVGPGSGGIAVGGAAAVTLADNVGGNALLFANAGDDTLIAIAGADTLVGGAGNDVFFAGTLAETVFLGAGANTVVAQGASTIVAAATGSGKIYADKGAVVFGGSATALIVAPASTTAGAYTIVGGAGEVQAIGGGNGTLLFAGSGATTLAAGAGFATIVGGSGTDVLADGGTATPYGGAADIFGGSGANTILAGASGTNAINGVNGSSIFLSGSGEAAFLVGASSNVVDVTASAGNNTLVAQGSTGTETMLLGGSGDQTAVYDGAGTDTAVLQGGKASVVSGSGVDNLSLSGAGGSASLFGFKEGVDAVDLTGVTATQLRASFSSATLSNGSISVVVSGATIEFVGMNHVAADYFHLG